MHEQARLTIAVPTYNRPQKVARLLEILKVQISQTSFSQRISIIISDNSGNEQTAAAFAAFSKDGLDVVYHKQKSNLGFDGNVRFLYTQSKEGYVWFMSDDDQPLEGSLGKILSAIDTNDPAALLFSFMQPPGSTIRQFDHPEDVHIVQNQQEAIRAAIRIPKLSIYVLRKVSFARELEKIHNSAIGNGWMFIVLTFSVLFTTERPMVLISEQLAACDEGYNHIWVPTPFLWLYRVAEHPYVKMNMPELKNELKDKGYIQCIMFSWALVRGKLLLDDTEGLKTFIKNLHWRMPLLMRHPKLLIMLFLMKTRLIPSFLKS